MADFFVVRSGSATIILGGALDEPRTVGPGELAAAHITGGEKREVSAGDIVYIPANLPHHVVLAPGQSVTYVIIKVKEPAAK